MKSNTTLGWVTVSAALVALSACASSQRTPDEFRVIRKAPLTVPPDFNLRPPGPGESRPTELEPDAQARVALFGSDFGQAASEGEKLFVKRAGAEAVDRAIRAAVDYDGAQLLRKTRSFTDRILFFRSSPDGEPVVDAEAEAERLRAEQSAISEITGGGEVMIRRRGTGKLPGL